MVKRVLRKQNHCAYECIYHIVLCTKYRREIFNDGVFAYMETTLKELHAHYPELDIVEINHDKDHIHIMLWIPLLKKVYWGTDSIWSDGYFVSMVGYNEELIRKYIEKQGEEDAGRAQLVML